MLYQLRGNNRLAVCCAFWSCLSGCNLMKNKQLALYSLYKAVLTFFTLFLDFLKISLPLLSSLHLTSSCICTTNHFT